MQVLPPWNFSSSVSWLNLPQWEKADPCFPITGAVFLRVLYLTQMEEIFVLASLHSTFQWTGYLT